MNLIMDNIVFIGVLAAILVAGVWWVKRQG